MASSLQPRSRAQWRKWLAAHHASSTGLWLILVKKNAALPGVGYDEAVEEALCFGWIDSRTQTVDARRYKIWMSPRKRGGVWSKSNKQRVARLLRDGLMKPPGLAKIEAAKQDGSWNLLDQIDKLTIPPDFGRALRAEPGARRNFERFADSAKRIILYWILSAKTAATRQKRIEETVRLARRNLRAAHPEALTRDGRAPRD
jgi:uncharacterized protein YdeI (YjbR/CyaY-like superfamily)